MSKSFDNSALKKWSLLFSTETRIDTCSYLIASLVPISYTRIVKGVNLCVVDLDELKTHTPFALRGAKLLVDGGCATWVEFTENPKATSNGLEDNSTGVFAIGKIKGFGNLTYFMEDLLQEKQEEYVEELREEKTDAYSDTMGTINEVFDSYRNFCESNGFLGSANKLYGRIKIIFNKAKSSKLTRSEFLEYLYLINAMVFDLIKFPDEVEINKKVKELSMATQIVGSLTSEDAIKIVPYFVLNYHTFARRGAEETSIYNLKFNLNTVLTKMRGSGVKELNKINSDNDSL